MEKKKPCVVKDKEILASSDVTIESKKALRLYAWVNFACFVIQLFVIVALQMQWIGSIQVFNLNWTNSLPIVPVYINNYFINIGWLLCVCLQGLFVLRGLPFMKPGAHYANCVLLKITFWFILLCLILTLSLVTFSYTAETKIGYFVMIPLASLVLLKCKSNGNNFDIV